MATQARTDEAARMERVTILNRLSKIREKIEDEKEYRDFAASNAMDFKMSNARLKGLKAERSELKKLLRKVDE